MTRPRSSIINASATDAQRADTVVVLDFETTGLSPTRGDRAIEIGAVKLVNGLAVDRFQELMHPGRRISSFIEDYTGISNAMLQSARPCGDVMNDFADFIAGTQLVAHNTSFDRRFLEAELALIGRGCSESYSCTMLTSRRLFPELRSHKLSALVDYHQIPHTGVFHRALADAEMTSLLWLTQLRVLERDYQLASPSFALMQRLTTLSKAKVPDYLKAAAAYLS